MYHNISRTREEISRGWALPVVYKTTPLGAATNGSSGYNKNRTERRTASTAEFLSEDRATRLSAVPVTDSRRSANAYIRRQVCHREGQQPLSRAGLPDEHAATWSFPCNLCLSFRPVFWHRKSGANYSRRNSPACPLMAARLATGVYDLCRPE